MTFFRIALLKYLTFVFLTIFVGHHPQAFQLSPDQSYESTKSALIQTFGKNSPSVIMTDHLFIDKMFDSSNIEMNLRTWSANGQRPSTVFTPQNPFIRYPELTGNRIARDHRYSNDLRFIRLSWEAQSGLWAAILDGAYRDFFDTPEKAALLNTPVPVRPTDEELEGLSKREKLTKLNEWSMEVHARSQAIKNAWVDSVKKQNNYGLWKAIGALSLKHAESIGSRVYRNSKFEDHTIQRRIMDYFTFVQEERFNGSIKAWIEHYSGERMVPLTPLQNTVETPDAALETRTQPQNVQQPPAQQESRPRRGIRFRGRNH